MLIMFHLIQIHALMQIKQLVKINYVMKQETQHGTLIQQPELEIQQMHKKLLTQIMFYIYNWTLLQIQIHALMQTKLLVKINYVMKLETQHGILILQQELEIQPMLKKHLTQIMFYIYKRKFLQIQIHALMQTKLLVKINYVMKQEIQHGTH